MNLLEAQQTLTDSVLWSGESYPKEKLNRAIRYVLQDFINDTKCARKVGVVSVSSGDDVLDILASLPDFNIESMDGIRIGKQPYITQVGVSEILGDYKNHPDKVGEPTKIAFETPDKGMIFPVSDDNYDFSVVYSPPLTAFAVDTNTPETIELNIPDRFIDAALWHGCKAALTRGQTGAKTSEDWAIYTQYKYKIASKVNRVSFTAFAGTAI
ncbi:hypothetical protein KS4_23430 [Poriferisphaera corsica]|uniref:Uncharacterized protein n=2 Tax=Poriferisphaera corsica TaxID=2528020 RepID=A0A517YVN9_9BACT|nr:hypothetical protein KS4_23430 [Poriferisphaera corsica]